MNRIIQPKPERHYDIIKHAFVLAVTLIKVNNLHF
jgi:hypothetical protein